MHGDSDQLTSLTIKNTLTYSVSTQVKPNSVSWQQLWFFCENKYIGIEYKLLAYGKQFFKDL